MVHMATQFSFGACVILRLLASSAAGQNQANTQEDAWDTLIGLAEAIIGDDGVATSDDKLDALVDFHVDFSRNILGKPIPSQRVVAVKRGLRTFVVKAAERYKGDKRRAALRLLRDLAANRAVFIELLSSDHPVGATEEQMLAYLERNRSLSYQEPVRLNEQLRIEAVDADLEIVAEGSPAGFMRSSLAHHWSRYHPSNVDSRSATVGRTRWESRPLARRWSLRWSNPPRRQTCPAGRNAGLGDRKRVLGRGSSERSAGDSRRSRHKRN